MNWQTEKRWSDRFLPEIKQHLASYLLQVADEHEDAKRNTDLMTLRISGGVRIACRVRRHQYFKPYGSQFTIRASRSSGWISEWAKLLSGWGDLMFYGFADETESHLHAWWLGNLHLFRLWVWSQYQQNGQWPGTVRENGDGGSAFRVFELADLPGRFLVSQGGCPLEWKA